MDSSKEEVGALLRVMVETFFGRRRNLTKEKIDSLENGFIIMLKNNSQKHFSNKEMVEKLIRIVKLFAEFMRRPDILENIRSCKLSKNELLNRFQENELGIDKRKYDMSDLYNFNLVAKLNKTSREKAVSLKVNSRPIIHQYYDLNNKAVSITDIGELLYQEWNGVNSSITAYRILQEGKDGNLIEHIVFSHIIIYEMENQEYKDAVLNELLSENNITKSRLAGYIGEIVKVDTQAKMSKIGTENHDCDKYQYKISKNYMLQYDAMDASAIVDFFIQEKNRKISEKRHKKQVEEENHEDR